MENRVIKYSCRGYYSSVEFRSFDTLIDAQAYAFLYDLTVWEIYENGNEIRVY